VDAKDAFSANAAQVNVWAWVAGNISDWEYIPINPPRGTPYGLICGAEVRWTLGGIAGPWSAPMTGSI
jgi:hypothetical protein